MSNRDLIQKPVEDRIDYKDVDGDLEWLIKNLEKGLYGIPGQMVTTLVDALNARRVFCIAKTELDGKRKTPEMQDAALKKVKEAGTHPRKIETLLRANRASLCQEYCSAGKKCAKKRGYRVQICHLECSKLGEDD